MESYYHILFDNLPEDQLEEKKLGDLVKIVGGCFPSAKIPEYWTKSGAGIPWIGIKDLTKNKGKFISRGEKDITDESMRCTNSKLISKNSILFSCMGTIGFMGVNDIDLCISESLFGILIPRNTIHYFWFLLKNNSKEFKDLSVRSVVNGLSLKLLREFPILCPTQELIDNFNQFCEPFFKLQKNNEREIRELLKLQKYFVELTN